MNIRIKIRDIKNYSNLDTIKQIAVPYSKLPEFMIRWHTVALSELKSQCFWTGGLKSL